MLAGPVAHVAMPTRDNRRVSAPDVDARRAALRAAPLDERVVDPDPIRQFARWYAEAAAAAVDERAAMVLATVATDGTPSARVVLLRGLDERGFVFFTNLDSDKALDLAADPRAAVVFHWRELNRQVRAVGRARPVPEDESDAYFATRPRGHRLSAWASPQSSVLAGRDDLERRVEEVAARFEGRELPRPPFWGGYVVTPVTVELWQGRPDRRHDRVRYRATDGAWVRERLAP